MPLQTAREVPSALPGSKPRRSVSLRSVLIGLGSVCVVCAIAPYNDFVIDGVTGYLVKTEDEWKKRLTELINDADARDEMGAKAKAHAADFTIQGNWPKWRDAYEKVTGYER